MYRQSGTDNSYMYRQSGNENSSLTSSITDPNWIQDQQPVLQMQAI